MSNTELKIVVDVSKPLKEVGAVSALLAVYNAAWDVVRDLVMQPLTGDDTSGRMFTLSTDLHDKLRQAFMDAGEFGAIDQILNRQPAIVGAETQVGQFVTASPAYGVYEGQKHISCDACGDTGKVTDTEGNVWPCYRQHAQEDFQPESVAAAHPQGFKATEGEQIAMLKELGVGVPEKIDVERSFFRQIIGNYIAVNQPLDENITVNDMVAHIIEIVTKRLSKPARVTETGQSALEGIMSAMDNANADDMRDAARYRTLLRCLEIDSDMSEKGYKPSDGEVEAMRRLFADKFTTKETANAAIDGIIADKLLGEHQ